MRDKPSGPPQCFNCGADTNDWDYIGYRMAWVCGDQRCHNEMRDEHGAMIAEAAWEAARDQYERYW